VTGTRRSLSGWGRTSPSVATVRVAHDVDTIASAIADDAPRGVLARGLGRSYGDVAQNGGGLVLDLTALSGIERLDPDAGTVTALAGTSFDAMLRELVPAGWFVPVTPGTRWVTLGGAIANDVHGKNHHREGSLGAHVLSIDLMTADGTVRPVTHDDDRDTFEATIGGAGLTGVIVRATIRLLPISTSRVRVDTERGVDLDDLMARMEAGDAAYRYSVAWIDCLSSGGSLGRGVLSRGDHAEVGELPPSARLEPHRYRPRVLPPVPPRVPRLVSLPLARAFNEAWFRRAPTQERGALESIASFFHPLDAIGDWNRAYGRDGFVQYQFAVPFGQEHVIQLVIERLVAHRVTAFLGVLKRFGRGTGLLSFPIEGWTLAIDLPARSPGLHALLATFDRQVADAGGRVYLAKDSTLDRALLPAMYPELDRWREIRERLDPSGIWRSDLGRRLGLVAHDRAERRWLVPR
jgi:decaprenylphospho-beta-D-ribofuranose 2-oxidase